MDNNSIENDEREAAEFRAIVDALNKKATQLHRLGLRVQMSISRPRMVDMQFLRADVVRPYHGDD